MQRQLEVIIDQFEAARTRVHTLGLEISSAQWTTRYDPQRWSVGECIAHLNLTSRAYLPTLRAAFQQHPAQRRHAGRYRHDVVGWLLGFAVGPLPNVGRLRIGRVRTTAAFVPAGDFSCEHTVAEFDDLQNQQIDITKAAAGRPLHDIRIASPFDPRISYNAYSCLALLPRHQMRHVWQAEHVWPRGNRQAG